MHIYWIVNERICHMSHLRGFFNSPSSVDLKNVFDFVIWPISKQVIAQWAVRGGIGKKLDFQKGVLTSCLHIYWIGNERILSYKPSTGMKNNWEVASNAQISQKRQKIAILQMFFGLVRFASIFVPSRNYRIWSPWSEKNSLVWYNHCHFSSFSTKVDRTFKNTEKITMFAKKSHYI